MHIYLSKQSTPYRTEIPPQRYSTNIKTSHSQLATKIHPFILPKGLHHRSLGGYYMSSLYKEQKLDVICVGIS